MNHRLMRGHLVALSVGVAQAVAVGQMPDRAAFAARADSLAAEYLTKLPASSIAIAVVQGRDTLVMRGYGLADRETKRVADANTIYEIASITKQFTAAAVMRLGDQGKLGIDDDASKYLTKFPFQGHRVTIRNLLNHTSGIHDYTAKPEFRARPADDFTPDSIVDFVASDSFDFMPGTEVSYSNTGYVLLGMIIERVSGRTYAAFLEQEFFKPLGLTRTHYCEQPEKDPNVAKGYSDRNGELVPAAYLSLTQPYAAGAICSTVADLARWVGALHDGHVVSASSYASMITPPALSGGGRSNYGFGLNIIAVGFSTVGRHRAITHNGDINGFLTEQWYYPDDKLNIVVLTNTDAKAPDGLAGDLARIVLEALAARR